jgi:manganese transport system permease protein
MMLYSVGSSVSACVLGTYLSYHFDVSTGGSIVVVLTALFVLAMIFAPKYGILAQAKGKRSALSAEDELQTAD